MLEHIVIVAILFFILYRIEHHGYHTKRVLMAMRDILAQDRQS